LARFLETAGSVLNYFEPFLGRIEILGGSKRIERVYFEIKESNIEQWEKPQIKVRNISLVLVFIWIPIDCLCGLVVRVLGYRSGDPGAIPGTTRKKKVVGLERGALSLVSTTKELLDRKVAALV
jgi:hypothetical protein